MNQRTLTVALLALALSVPQAAEAAGSRSKMIGTTVALNLRIPFADLFQDPSVVHGEVDVAKHGPFTISFGVRGTVENIQWVRFRSTKDLLVLPSDVGGVLSPAPSGGLKEFVVGGDVDGVDGLVEPAFLVDAGTNAVKIDVSWYQPARAFVELTVFSTNGAQPRLLKYARRNVREVDPADVPSSCSSRCSQSWFD
jgi:hypothetical protein